MVNEHGSVDDGPLCAALLDGLLRISQIVRLRFNDWLGAFNLNDGRHSVLVALARAGESGCSQAELAERLGLSESNISTLIERMQRDGWVNRSRSDADRRKRVLSITSSGRSTLGSVDGSRSVWAERLMHGISASDRSRLSSILQRLGSSLDSPIEISPPTLTVYREPDEGRDSTVSPSSSDPIEDPHSPQYALRQMLLALSHSVANESNEKEAA